MSKQSPFALALSLCLLSACSVQEAKQAVQVNAPTTQNTNSNNQSNTTQTNTGSGTQINNNGSGSSNTNTGTQTNNTNSGSGNQTSNTNTGSGSQTNTTVNNTQTGEGTIVQPVNTGSGTQTTTVVTCNQNNNTVNGNQTIVNGNQNNTTNNVSGNQTVVNGNQTNNNTTINYNITYIQQFNTKLVYNLNQAAKLETSWEAVPNTNKYAVYLNNQFHKEVSAASISLELSNEQIENTTIGVAAVPADVPNSALSTPPAVALLDSIQATTFSGTVYEDTGLPLNGAQISAKSLNSVVPFDAQVITGTDGRYTFNLAPTDIQIEIVARKDGYTYRRRIEVMQPNPQRSTAINQFSFTGESNSLSNKPEVVIATPARNGSGVSPETSIVLKFSEPMDRATVQNSFALYSFNNSTLSVANGASVFYGSGDVNIVAGTPIWNKSAFNITWNSDDTEATFAFKDGIRLPSDSYIAYVPDYRVVLEGEIKDKSGTARSTGEKKFKLTEGNFEASYKFSIRSDETHPVVDWIDARAAENGSSGDLIKVRFSEPMRYNTLGNIVAGGMGGNILQAVAAIGALPASGVANNYTVSVIRTGTTLLNQVTWGSLGGGATFDINDTTNKTVLLQPPTAGTDLFKPGDTVRVTVADSVLDPAGNGISSGPISATAQ